MTRPKRRAGDRPWSKQPRQWQRWLLDMLKYEVESEPADSECREVVYAAIRTLTRKGKRHA